MAKKSSQVPRYFLLNSSTKSTVDQKSKIDPFMAARNFYHFAEIPPSLNDSFLISVITNFSSSIRAHCVLHTRITLKMASGGFTFFLRQNHTIYCRSGNKNEFCETLTICKSITMFDLTNFREERAKRKEEERKRKEEEKRWREEEKMAELKRKMELMESHELVFDSMAVEFDVDDDLNLADVEDGNDEDLEAEIEDDDDDDDEDDDEDDMEGYEMPIGPLPQMVTNDLKSLDEMVRLNGFVIRQVNF